MGAWHHGPFENDSALDWVGGIESEIAKRIRCELKSRTSARDAHFEKVAAAALLVELTVSRTPRLHLDLNYDALHRGLFTLAIKAIREVREDHEAIAAWKHPKLYAKSLDDLLDALKWRKMIATRRFNKLKARIVIRRSVPAKKSHKARKRSAGGNS
jgi:Domain of unknown function (DUF4259)